MTPRTTNRTSATERVVPAGRTPQQLRATMLLALLAWALSLPSGLAAIPGARTSVPPRTFPNPQEAADALLAAAEKFDEAALEQIFGSEGKDIVLSGETALDRELAAKYVAMAHEKMSVTMDPLNKNHAIVVIGNDDWPFAIPIVKKGGAWSYDAVAGRQELLYRRVGRNELDAIEICHGYVEAQKDYALQKRGDSGLNQYAQRLISTPGTQDGLAWQNPDGTWDGPVGEKIARIIEQGYSSRAEPYHGYYFKVLKGQGPAAPLGEMDFLVKGVMIGGFALVAAPAQYRVTGVKTFIVSHDGIVYEKDLGAETAKSFEEMERYDPDPTWDEVLEEE